MGLRSAIIAQFRQPHGTFGHVAGWILAQRGSNRARNRWTVDLLALEPHHRVLEIGCGPGGGACRLRTAADDRGRGRPRSLHCHD